MDQLIEKISIDRVLLAIHEYLVKKPYSPDAKSDEIGIRITKTIINEIVKIKQNSVWENYESIEAHSAQDVYIRKWIEIILDKSGSGGSQSSPTKPAQVQQDHLQPDEYTGGLSLADHRRMKILIEEAT